MSIITIDAETYYAKDYSLSKMTTEEYIRDPRFQIIGVSTKVDTSPAQWFSGTHREIKEHLAQFDWENSAVLAHNMLFDGAILSWRLGIHPKILLDTLSMARALNGPDTSVSLKNLAVRYGVGVKGEEVHSAIGLRRQDFGSVALAQYGAYCCNDVDLCRKLFDIMSVGFPKSELKLIDLTLKMFTEPVLELNKPHLEQHLLTVQTMKQDLLIASGVDKKELMSNPKFAQLLEELGVDPPMKISPTTGKLTHAFAKSDEAFKALADHEDARVQVLVAARLGNKSTLEETRTQRFIDISDRGKFPVPLRYYAAHTGRWGGDDKVNLQNLPSRGPNAKALKKAIIAAIRSILVESDSSQIEARVLAWLAGQEDVVEAFALKQDVYKKMAASIYNVLEELVTKDQRFVGKTTVLGAGYGMGGEKFQGALKAQGVTVTLIEAQRIISVYRQANSQIVALWKEAGVALKQLARGNSMYFGRDGLLYADGAKQAILLPNGMYIYYPDLREDPTDRGVEYSYKTRIGRTRIYGGKVVENVVQALARIIVGEQMIAIAKRHRPVLTVHDSVVCCVPEAQAEEAKSYIEMCMSKPPVWAEGLPVACEAGIGRDYGSCE